MNTSDFIQSQPTLSNQFTSDPVLRDYLNLYLPEAYKDKIFKDLERFGDRVINDIWDMACDAENNQPKHIPFDGWGKRIDIIEVSKGWKDLDKVSAEEGLVSIGYNRKFGAHSRLYQYAKMYLFHPASAYYGCPLAMTDGAAKLIELYGNKTLQDAFNHLISQKPDEFWTSGQWMTEKTGGSDVGRSQTKAVFKDGKWRLYGTKWFTSAITSQMAMTLARIVNENGESIKGSRGLSLFYLEIRDKEDNLNGIEILRLKDKLGTKALPTAELKLNGTVAQLLGREGEGVKSIASLFNITRIQNSFAALGTTRRVLNLAKSYSSKREAFGKLIKEHSLHIKTLSKLELLFHSMFHLCFYTVRLLGKSEYEEVENTSEEKMETEKMIRILTPVIKLYTAKQNMNIVSEVVESFGGAGYCEDTGIPRWLRDSQTLTIWEGTTNILCLDLLRAIQKEEVFPVYIKKMKQIIEPINSKEKTKVTDCLNRLNEEVQKFASIDAEDQQVHSRALAFSIAEITSAVLMLDFSKRQGESSHSNAKLSSVVANKWCKRQLIKDFKSNKRIREEDSFILYQS